MSKQESNMQENETAQLTPEAITGKAKSQETLSEALPPAFTHPIEHFRLRCLDLATVESGFAQNPEDIIKTAKLYADFVLGASGGIAPECAPYIVGERGLETLSSLDLGIIESLTSPAISQAEQRLHTLQRLFDEIEPHPDYACVLETVHHSMTLKICSIRRVAEEINASLNTLQEEIDNMTLDIIEKGNADFLLKESKLGSFCTAIKGNRVYKRDRLWKRKAEKLAVSS